MAKVTSGANPGQAQASSREPKDVGDIPADIAALSFEAALEELDGIVARLEGGKVDLEESIGIYTRGAQLKRHCEMKLRAAEERIEKIVLGADGAVKTTAFDAD